MAGYMGDKSSMVVHHLAMMSVDCKIHDVEKTNMHYFTPDVLDQAKKENFTPCRYCNEITT
jgi:hypothetical protein